MPASEAFVEACVGAGTLRAGVDQLLDGGRPQRHVSTGSRRGRKVVGTKDNSHAICKVPVDTCGTTRCSSAICSKDTLEDDGSIPPGQRKVSHCLGAESSICLPTDCELLVRLMQAPRAVLGSSGNTLDRIGVGCIEEEACILVADGASKAGELLVLRAGGLKGMRVMHLPSNEVPQLNPALVAIAWSWVGWKSCCCGSQRTEAMRARVDVCIPAAAEVLLALLLRDPRVVCCAVVLLRHTRAVIGIGVGRIEVCRRTHCWRCGGGGWVRAVTPRDVVVGVRAGRLIPAAAPRNTL
mmetsp:Transcript_40348/g.94835  ORF Transcript_40348/g.94835 Transcript_40348/m.94835 type:complete len:296 (+) Transcript_40348:1543-2430(+)